ncbi:MAG TPA: GAF domain-containing protein [Acidimicrobiales bacterium]|nr:GAF domain-containing protein [Acidimicrobiales bacterium]
MSEELVGPLWDTLAMTVADRNRRPAEDLLHRLIKSARHHLGMEVSFISEFTGNERVLRYVDSVAPISVRVGDSDPLERSYCQRVVDGRLPELICVAWELPAALELSVTAALPIGAHIAVPLILSSGRVYGTFCAFSRRANRSLTERDLAVVHMFADIARQVIEDDLTVANQYNAALERTRSVLTGEGNLKIVFQPIFKLVTEELIGVEALSRFPQDPSRTPDIWFSEAASVGLGVDL